MYEVCWHEILLDGQDVEDDDDVIESLLLEERYAVGRKRLLGGCHRRR